MKSSNLFIETFLFATLAACFYCVTLTNVAQHAEGATATAHHVHLHNHMSRKILERACKASKDTLEEVLECMTKNEELVKHKTNGQKCYTDTFGVEFDPKDIMKHKELICNNREKVETLTACVYDEIAHADAKDIDKLAETMVDVGMCIINALDE